MRELDACAAVLLQQQESSSIVLAHMLKTVLSLSKNDVSALDKQRLRYDRQQSDRTSASSSLGAGSLPLSILKGDSAIDQALLQAIAPDFLLHALSVLHASSHPPQACRQRCCGVSRSLAGDLAACIAMLLPQILAEPDQPAEALQRLLPYLDACDTRVAMYVSWSLSTSALPIAISSLFVFAALWQISCANRLSTTTQTATLTRCVKCTTLQSKTTTKLCWATSICTRASSCCFMHSEKAGMGTLHVVHTRNLFN